MNRKYIQSGFSLVELLVALVLGLVVSAAAIQLFAGNKNTYRFESALSRLQENGRFAVDKMIEDIRMAGYTGCLSRGAGIAPNTALSPEQPPYTPDGSDGVRGYDYTTATWPAGLDNSLNLNVAGPTSYPNIRQVIAGTDVLNIQRVSSCGAQLTAALTGVGDTSIDIYAANDCDFNNGQVVMITDCESADLFQITTATSARLNRAIGSFTKNYSASATEVFRWESNAYYIAIGGSGELALFRSSWEPSQVASATTTANFTTAEIAQGVENLQILYGIDTGVDEYVDSYVVASAVTNWAQVRSVRITLIMRSADNVTQVSRPFIVNGVDVNTGSDRRLRSMYTTTVSLRNDTP